MSEGPPALVTPATTATVAAKTSDEKYILFDFSFFKILSLTHFLFFYDIYKDIVLNPYSIALEAKEHTISSKKHAYAKVTIADDFFNIISKVEVLKALVDLVPVDSSIPSIQTRRFYLRLRGNRDEKKVAVLNLSLLHFVQKYKRKIVPWDIPKSKRGQFNLKYQPGSFDTCFQILFGILKSNDIVYGLKEFKKRTLPFMAIRRLGKICKSTV